MEEKNNVVHICRPGEHGFYVYGMQYLLKENKYWCQATGRFDTDTANWLRKFQLDNGIRQTATCTEDTWNALFAGKVVRIGDHEFAVRAMQYLLNAHEYILEADGLFGDNTYNAVCAFQEDHGQEVTGECGKEMWQELILDI